MTSNAYTYWAMKTCTACGETKPLEAFTTSKRTRDGRNPRCKECVNAATRDWYQRNLDANRAKKRAYRADNQEALRAAGRERMRRWREENPEEARTKATEASRRFRELNPDYRRDWYQRNIETSREQARIAMASWREANPEEERAIRRRYREANIDVVRKRERENTHRRRALKGSTSPALAEHMAYLLTLPCAYCGSTENITIDHVVPLSRGGDHEAANLASACQPCNCSKGAKLLDKWDHGDPVVP